MVRSRRVAIVARALAARRVDLSAAELVDGLGQQFAYVGGSFQRENRETGGHGDCVSLTAAGLTTFFAGLGLFAVLIGVVEEAVGFAGLDIGVAAGADFADVVAAGVLGGSFWMSHVHVLLNLFEP